MRTLRPVDAGNLSNNERKRRARAFHKHLARNHPLAVKTYTTLRIGADASLSTGSVVYARSIDEDGTILATSDGRLFRIRVEEVPPNLDNHAAQPAAQA